MDHTFQVPGGANDAVLDLAVQADGRVVVVGEFTAFRGVALNRIARLNADGSLDGSFLPGTGMNSDVRDVVVDDSGRILAGGQFTQVAGTTQRYLARLTETGAVDPFFSMAVGFNNAVNALAIQPDGRILAAGAFTTVNQIGRARVVRLGTDASVDLTFDPGSGPSTTVLAVAAPANGNVLIGGQFTSVAGTTRRYVARLNADPRPEPPAFRLAIRNTDDGVRVDVFAERGFDYSILRSYDLRQWHLWMTVSGAGLDSEVRLLDPTSKTQPHAAYRGAYP